MKNIFLIIHIACCSVAFSQTHINTKPELIGKVKSVQQMTYLAEDVFGEIKIGKLGRDEEDDEESEDNFLRKNDEKGEGYELITYDAFGDEYKKVTLISKGNIVEQYFFEQGNDKKLKLNNKIVTTYSNEKHSKILDDFSCNVYDSLINRKVYNYDSKGQLLTVVSVGAFPLTITITYDGKGRKLEESHVGTNEYLHYKVIYNKTGKPTEMYCRGMVTLPEKYDYSQPISNSLIKTTFAYDKRGRLIERVDYENDTIPVEREMHWYIKGGRLVETNLDKINDELCVKNYDAKQNLVEEILYDYDGDSEKKIDEMYFYTYDAKNNLIQRREYHESGLLYETIRFEYSYDKKGNWVTRKKIKEGVPELFITLRTIEY